MTKLKSLIAITSVLLSSLFVLDAGTAHAACTAWSYTGGWSPWATTSGTYSTNPAVGYTCKRVIPIWPFPRIDAKIWLQSNEYTAFGGWSKARARRYNGGFDGVYTGTCLATSPTDYLRFAIDAQIVDFNSGTTYGQASMAHLNNCTSVLTHTVSGGPNVFIYQARCGVGFCTSP